MLRELQESGQEDQLALLAPRIGDLWNERVPYNFRCGK